MSLWQIGREMPQVKHEVSQISLQIRQGSWRDGLLAGELHGEAAERHHQPAEPREWLRATRLRCAARLRAGRKITPPVFCSYLHFAFYWTKEMGVHELKAVTYPGQVSRLDERGSEPCSVAHFRADQRCWSVPVLQVDDHQQFTSSLLALISTPVKSRQDFFFPYLKKMLENLPPKSANTQKYFLFLTGIAWVNSELSVHSLGDDLL